MLFPNEPMLSQLQSAWPSPAANNAHQRLHPETIEQACQQACQQIAPTWPLDQSIAVNPHWKRIHLPVRTVAARMAVLAGLPVFPARETFRQAWQDWRITEADLQHALQQLGSNETPEAMRQALTHPLHISPLPLLIDVLDDDAHRFQRLSWRDAITHQVSQTCAAYFDQAQSDWQPQRSESLYAFWRDTLVHDHGIGTLMGLPNLHAILDYLPPTRQQAERWAVEMLGLDAGSLADYFEAVLLTVNGWASWCAYLGWQAQLNGQTDDNLRDLLAIRLAWGVVVMQCKGLSASHGAIRMIQQTWQAATSQIRAVEETLRVDEVWQLALEIGYQRSLAEQFRRPLPAPTPAADTPLLQAAFCIDVRSEPMRRALEQVSPFVQTLGVAGFFGLPVAYQSLTSCLPRPQLPGLLAPSQLVADQVLVPAISAKQAATIADAGNQDNHAQGLQDISAAVSQQRRQQMQLEGQVERLTQYPGAAFSLVETAGPLFLKPLLSLVRPRAKARQALEHQSLPKRYQAVTRPILQALSDDEKIALSARILHSLGLKPPFAPVVLLVGHASQSANNAHAASLDCGACCGQSGEANSRALAWMLNEPAVREGLAARGLSIPSQTRFVAALHNTTTQEIHGFDLDLLDAGSQAHWQQVQSWLEQAGHLVRQQQWPRQQSALTSSPAPDDMATLFKLFRQRANDAAQTRPEWGLANNAAFIMAPRARTQHLNLDGRAFLHEYHADQDTDGSVLELLMTAPMLVTHWINWQYHASTCAPDRLGSGNKLLHNVVGGHIGVFEGNGGDLRIGLSRQSLHNGKQWMHEPVRLTVMIVASRARIQHIIDKHAVVKQLVSHGWCHLWCEDEHTLWQYQPNPSAATANTYWQQLSL